MTREHEFNDIDRCVHCGALRFEKLRRWRHFALNVWQRFEAVEALAKKAGIEWPSSDSWWRQFIAEAGDMTIDAPSDPKPNAS